MSTFNLLNYWTTTNVVSFGDLLGPISMYANNSNIEGAALNDVVRVPLITCGTGSNSFTYSGGYSGTNTTANGKNVTLSNLFYQPITLTDQDIAVIAKNPSTITNMINAAVRHLASDVISSSFASTVNITNYPTSQSFTSSQFASGTTALVALDTFANTNKWTDRNLVSGVTLWSNLVQNSAVIAASNFGTGEVIQKGSLDQVFGFKTQKVTVPLPSGATGFIANSNAMTIAFAYHKPAAGHNYTVAQALVDETTGIPLGIKQWYDPYKATTNIIIECLTGAAPVDSTALSFIK